MLHLSHCPTKPNFGLQNEPKLRYIAPSLIVACAVTPFVFAQTFTSGCFERDSTGRDIEGKVAGARIDRGLESGADVEPAEDRRSG